MNDIQEKENICVAAGAAIARHTANLNTASRHVKRLKSLYLQAVVDVAVADERLQRKKKFLASAICWVIYVILTLIVFAIHRIGGLMFFCGVGIIALLWRDNTREAKTIKYNNRKNFFAKYAEAVPADEKLNWKPRPITYSGPIEIELEEGEWECRSCGAVNEETSVFCTECGSMRNER